MGYCQDQAGRVVDVKGKASASVPLAEMARQRTKYNVRLQPQSIETMKGSTHLLKLTLGYGTTAAENNGNVRAQLAEYPSRTAGMDTISAGSRNSISTGRMSRTTGSTESPMTILGNMKAMGAGIGLVYDAQSLLKKWVTTVGARPGTTEYWYDGNRRRVRKEGSGGSESYVYNVAGQMIEEITTETTRVELGLRRMMSDHLGSTTLVPDGAGGIKKCYDSLPFGEEIVSGENGRATADFRLDAAVVDRDPNKFTGKERDAETGLDYFGARYMSSAQGRFTNPDVPMLAQHPAEPQSWNLYTYTANNPLTRIDPDGRNWFNIGGSWQWHEGSDVNSDGDPCKKSSKGCNHSDYTHLLVFQKTGQNSKGAAVGTLTLYGNDQGKAIMSSPIFSGGGPDLGSRTLAAGDGNYRIDLGRFETLQSSDIQTGIGENGLRYGYLGPHYGVQDLPESLMGSSSPWGSIRARLNEWVAGGAGLPENMKGLFLHGSWDGHDYTNGCLCERSEKILRWIRDTARNKTPGVFPTIPVLVQK